MKFSILASGSKGNCSIVESNGVKIMIDCGTTKKYLTHSFDYIDIDVDTVNAVLITHDHSDHTSQLKLFHHLEVYSPTPLPYEHQLVEAYVPFIIEHITITPIQTSHDAGDSVGYIIEDGTSKLVYITDTGYIRDRDLKYLASADFYIMESNHDPELLMETSRPYFIKRRILSDTGHLSNHDAGTILGKVVSDQTKEIVLAHMSEQANNEQVALNTVRSFVKDTRIKLSVAKQYEIIMGGNQK